MTSPGAGNTSAYPPSTIYATSTPTSGEVSQSPASTFGNQAPAQPQPTGVTYYEGQPPPPPPVIQYGAAPPPMGGGGGPPPRPFRGRNNAGMIARNRARRKAIIWIIIIWYIVVGITSILAGIGLFFATRNSASTTTTTTESYNA